MSASWGDMPGNQIVNDGQTIRLKSDGSGFESYGFSEPGHTHVVNDLTDATSTGKSIIVAANAAAVRTLIGAGTSSFSGAYADLTGKPSLATVATSGSYTDLSNKPTIPTLPTFSQSSASRSLNSGFIPSAARNTLVTYSVDIACTSTLVGGQSGTVFLEISADGSTGWQEVARSTNANSVSLAIALTLNQSNTANLAGAVPAGWTVRLRTANNTGTPTFTYRSGQEATL